MIRFGASPRIHRASVEVYLRGQAGLNALRAVGQVGARRLRAVPARLPAIGALEYIIIAAVLIAVVGVGMNSFGLSIQTAFTNLSTSITSQSWAGGGGVAPVQAGN